MHTFDPRPWNLFVSTALLVGCGPQRLSGDDDETTASSESTANATESDSTDTTENGDVPECRTDDDCVFLCDDGECVECIYSYQCGRYHECISGICEFAFGRNPCESVYDCPPFEVCEYFGFGEYCQPAGSPVPECDEALTIIPTVLELGAPPLALSFVDVDADGQRELVVVTETELLVYEHGMGEPTVTERAVASNAIQTMVAAPFDDQIGEDIVLLVGAEHHRYFSDGVAGFVNATIDPSPMSMPQGLLADDFDGQGAFDILLWGFDGALLYLGDSPAITLHNGEVASAAAFDFASPHASVLIGSPSYFQMGDVYLYDLMGAAITEAVTGNGNGSVIALSSPEQGRFAGASYHASTIGHWSEIVLRDPANAHETDTFSLLGLPSLLAGDFDGDQYDEILVSGDNVELILDVFDAPCAATIELGLEPATLLPTVGDHDGDGDDELAVATATGEVLLVNIE